MNENGAEGSAPEPPGSASAREKSEKEPKDESDRLRDRLEAFIPDMLRKTFYAGVGALFSSEEGIRKLAKEFSLPKDVASYLVTQARNSQDEILRIIGNELRRFFDGINLSDELQRLMTTVSLELRTEIRFVPNEARPKVKQKLRVKRREETGS